MDISIENIMVAHRDGKVFGVLLDWNLAGVPIPRHRPKSEMKRIGTKPFMSVDFYATWWTGEHLYRHDLESFYYVLAAFCAGFDPGKRIVRVPDDWRAEAKSGKADRRRDMSTSNASFERMYISLSTASSRFSTLATGSC